MLTYTPFSATAAFMEVLSGRTTIGPGDRGAHVRVLEETLVALGYGLAGGATPDVVFGKGTQGALLRFQKDKALPQTGKLDRETLEAMDRAAVAKRPGAAGTPTKADTRKHMSQLLLDARRAGTSGGSRVTREELTRALDALKLDDGIVSAEEYAAAKTELESEAFQKAATPDAKDFAREWLALQAAATLGSAAAFKVRKLDAAGRDAAIGASPFTRDVQAAEGRLTAAIPPGPRLEATIEDVARRAFGRAGAAGFDLEPMRFADPSDVKRCLGGAGAGPAEADRLARHLAERAGGSGRLFAGAWRDRRPGGGGDERGHYIAVLASDAVSVLVLDVLTG